MEPTILRKDALEIIHSGVLLQEICFVTADRKRGTGGNYLVLKNYRKLSPKKGDKSPNEGAENRVFKSRKPAHHENRTVNLHDPARPFIHPHKVHIRLITKLNGKRVIQ